MYGEIKPKDVMYFREAAGNAAASDGTEYELSTSVNTGAPIIRSSKTEKWFLLSWQDIVNMAIEAGIDKDGEIS